VNIFGEHWKPDFDLTTFYEFDAKPEELMGIVKTPERLLDSSYSVYLNTELIDQGASDGSGTMVRIQAKGWLPHTFVFLVRIVEIDQPRSLTVLTQGDFEGIAKLSIESSDDDNHCVAKLHWLVMI